MFGRGGGGGVINRVTKEAGSDPITEFAFQGGMYGNKRVTGDFDRALTDKLAFRLNGVYENSNSFRRYVGLDRAAINPTFTFTSGATTTIPFAYSRRAWSIMGLRYGSSPPRLIHDLKASEP